MRYKVLRTQYNACTMCFVPYSSLCNSLLYISLYQYMVVLLIHVTTPFCRNCIKKKKVASSGMQYQGKVSFK